MRERAMREHEIRITYGDRGNTKKDGWVCIHLPRTDTISLIDYKQIINNHRWVILAMKNKTITNKERREVWEYIKGSEVFANGDDWDKKIILKDDLDDFWEFDIPWVGEDLAIRDIDIAPVSDRLIGPIGTIKGRKLTGEPAYA